MHAAAYASESLACMQHPRPPPPQPQQQPQQPQGNSGQQFGPSPSNQGLSALSTQPSFNSNSNGMMPQGAQVCSLFGKAPIMELSPTTVITTAWGLKARRRVFFDEDPTIKGLSP
eukprot:1158655-Pelagomonas_calceolata.AAC.4